VNSTKQCPDCAEIVLAEARVCKHCGYRFDEKTSPAPAEPISDVPSPPPPPTGQPSQPVAARPPAPGWWVPIGFIALALAVVLGVVALPFWLLAVVPFVVGILLIVRRRTAIGVTMLVLALVLPIPGGILIATVALKKYRVPSGSMEPTLHIGDKVLADRTGISGIHVGEIVIFHPPAGAEQEICGPTPHTIAAGGAACAAPVPQEGTFDFIKRVVAGPGDTVSIVEGHVIRNGAREYDSYIRPCPGVSECNFRTPVKIPSGDWYMLGDNRGESDDSRFWGPVPTSWIVGVTIMRTSPLGRLSFF